MPLFSKGTTMKTPEKFTKAIQVLEDHIRNQAPAGYLYSTQTIIDKDNALAAPTMLVVLRYKGQVVYTQLILEKDGMSAANPRTVSDIGCNPHGSFVNKLVREMYPEEAVAATGGYLIIPDEVMFDDEERVINIMSQVAYMCQQRMLEALPGDEMREQFIDFVGARRDRQGRTRYILTTEQGAGQTQDIFGFPVRDDIIVRLSMENTVQRRDMPAVVTKESVFAVTGYIEFVLTSAPGKPFAWEKVDDKYLPRFVITGVFHDQGYNDTQINALALACVNNYMDTGDWYKRYVDYVGGSGWKDLAWLLPRGMSLGDVPKEVVPIRVLQHLMAPGYLVSMDMPNNLTTSIGMEIYYWLSRGVDSAKEHFYKVIAATTERGNIDMRNSSPIFKGIIIPMGHMAKEGGNWGDVRYLDGLSLFAELPPKSAMDFADALLGSRSPTGGDYGQSHCDMNSFNTRKEIQSAVGGKIYNNFAYRLDFPMEFLNSLSNEFNGRIAIHYDNGVAKRPSVPMY